MAEETDGSEARLDKEVLMDILTAFRAAVATGSRSEAPQARWTQEPLKHQ